MKDDVNKDRTLLYTVLFHKPMYLFSLDIDCISAWAKFCHITQGM